MNNQNLRPCEHKFTQEEAKRGGIASGVAKREKKTIQKILNDLLETPAKDSPHFSKIAKELGIEDNKSVKDLYATICLLNSINANADLNDLEKLSKLLGEDKTINLDNRVEDDALTKALKEEAEKMNNETD
jgi:DNA-directed RNA polymerase specialized sigma subunit